MKCSKCGKEISEHELLEFRGKADVTSQDSVSLSTFRSIGVAWDAHDSYDEEVKCPHCGQYTQVNP